MVIGALLAFSLSQAAVATSGRDAPPNPPHPLQVSTNISDAGWIQSDHPLEVRFNRALAESDGRVAVMIGATDWTALFERRGTTLAYAAGPVRLPAGESQLVVYVVTAANEWKPIAQVPLRVLTASGLEKADFLPKFSADNKGQVAQAHHPDSNVPPRETFQDLTLNLGLRTVHARRGVTAMSQVNFLGVSNRPEALRFGLEGNTAPKFDLADYLVELETPRAKLSVGHLVFNPHRQLVAAFASRGVSATLRAGRADLTVAAVNGNSIVGFDNLVGLVERRNQVRLITLGAELAKQPGAARLEAVFADGSLLPVSGFTQGQVNDAERGRGLGVRFSGAGGANRLRIDAGLARSRFTNPSDALLAQGLSVVPVRERTNDAAYADTTVELIRPGPSAGPRPVNLAATYRFERVEPLYRAIGVREGLRSDILLNTVELTGGWGPIVAQGSHAWSHDNLDDIASLLTTNTEITAANLVVPMASLRTTERQTAWLPIVTWTLNRTSEVGDGIPPDSGFNSASQIPDQTNTNHLLRSDWTFAKWRFGYALNRSFVDNRQQGRARADFTMLTQSITLALAPGPRFDVTIEAGLESATNHELARIARTRRVGLNGTWRPEKRSTVTAIVSRTSLRDPSATGSDIADVNLEYSYAIAMPIHGHGRPNARLFTRWSWQSADVLESLFGDPSQDRRNWALSTGVTVSLF